MDKRPTAVKRERPPPVSKSARIVGATPASRSTRSVESIAAAPRRDAGVSLTFTNTHKILFPEPGITKGDVLNYYQSIAPKLLPHLRDRPMTLERLPDGLSRPKAPHFWQKNTPDYYPDWIPRVKLPTERGQPVQYALVNDVRTLLYLVNQGTLTFHPFLSRTRNLDRPDYVLFDLDPHQSTFASAVKVARVLHDLLNDAGVDSFVKTSGKSGLHVLAPWTQRGDYDAARKWALGFAQRLEATLPDIATTKRNIKARGRRVYLDVMQNARGHHTVPPYVLRATPTATVSTPLEWSEVTARLRPERFDMRTALARFKKQRKDPLAALTG